MPPQSRRIEPSSLWGKGTTVLFNDYDYFYKVAHIGNITKAANEIHISQSALSKAILKLEKSLDCQLFYRVPTGVKLTPAGEVLYEGVKKSMALMDNTNEQIQRLKHAEYAEIRITTGEDLFLRYVLPQIKRYAKKYPNVIFKTVASLSSESIMNSLLSGDTDMGFLNVRPEHDNLDSVCIGCLHEVFLAGEIFSAKMGNQPVSWEKLVECPLLLHPRYTYTRRRFDNFMREKGIAPMANFESGNTNVLMRMAEADLGLALVTKETAQGYSVYDHLQIVEVDDPYPPRDIYVVWRNDKKMSDYLRELLNNVIQYAKE